MGPGRGGAAPLQPPRFLRPARHRRARGDPPGHPERRAAGGRRVAGGGGQRRGRLQRERPPPAGHRRGHAPRAGAAQGGQPCSRCHEGRVHPAGGRPAGGGGARRRALAGRRRGGGASGLPGDQRRPGALLAGPPASAERRGFCGGARRGDCQRGRGRAHDAGAAGVERQVWGGGQVGPAQRNALVLYVSACSSGASDAPLPSCVVDGAHAMGRQQRVH
mmetsp:Transcript_11486/g.28949  ORF Transcript_11486/g.28949 Transcript_11486/m.28949 type:complete len:219 (-) Transcript_11486:1779-2435(-)